MSRKVYRRPVGRVRRLNCVLAMLLLLITGRVRKLYVRFGSSRGGCPFHVMGKTRRGNFIHLDARREAYNPKAPSLRVWHQFDLAQHVGKGPHCAMPIFELDRFKPNELHHLKAQDVVFANSRWAGGSWRTTACPRTASSTPRWGWTSASSARAGAAGRGPGPTVFLNVGKWEYRKGHDVLLEAFNKAFEPTDNVRLVMNCHNPCFREEPPDEDIERVQRGVGAGYYTVEDGGEAVTVTTAGCPPRRTSPT
jgi:glycosyltransferase involved in cell wall biosynthesis